MKIWKYEISGILIALIGVLILINLGMFIGFGLGGLVLGSLVSGPLITLIMLLNYYYYIMVK